MQCTISKVEGIPTIIDTRGLIYLGTSSNIEMQEALRLGVRFKVEILEEIPEKYRGTPYPFEREEYWIRYYDAVNSEDYYNLAYPIFDKSSKEDKRKLLDMVNNIYGETLREVTSNAQTISRRVNTAKSLGFKNIEDFCLDIKKKKESGLNNSDISKSYSRQRHFIRSVLEYTNIERIVKERKYKEDLYYKNKAKYYRSNGASIHKIGELLNLDPVTIVSLLGTLKNIPSKGGFKVSDRLGITPEELGNNIIKLIKEGLKDKEIATKLGIRPFEVKRYLYKYIIEHVKINDLDGT